jgi:hypothetical protein
VRREARAASPRRRKSHVSSSVPGHGSQVGCAAAPRGSAANRGTPIAVTES